MNNSAIINDNGTTVVEGRSTRIVLLRDPVQLQGRRNQLGRSGPGPTKNQCPCKNINVCTRQLLYAGKQGASCLAATSAGEGASCP